MPDKKQGLLIESIEFAKTDGICPAKAEKTRKKACSVTRIDITSDEDSVRFKREKGTYITIEMDSVLDITDADFESVMSIVAKTIRSLARVEENSRILIVGIGNRNFTPDSLGPKCVDRIIVTRGFEKVMPELLRKDGYANVSAINANVFGITGIESAELTEGVAQSINPALVVVIDALATNNVQRLCKTVQISDTSLVPGGGIGNSRKKISSSLVDCKMISIGMPTLLDLESVKGFDFADEIMGVPVNIDAATDTAAKLIAFSLNKAFHYDLSTEDILKYLY